MAENAFTTREQEIMSLAWQCFEGEPKVDYKKLASLAGMTNHVSASNAWSRIKKKLAAQATEAGAGAGAGGDGGTEGDAATPKAKTPKAGTPGSKRKKGGEVDGDDEEVEATPTKKAKSGKGRKKSEIKVFEDDAEGDDKVKEEVEEE